MPSTSKEAPSRQVLEELPGRALKFTSAISKSRAIRAILAARGYTRAEHEKGKALLFEVAGFTLPDPEASEDPAVAEATAELDACDETCFRLIHAAVDRAFPEQSAFLFNGGLAASKGAAAVLGWNTMLDRLDALESGKDRKDTHKADLAALAAIAKRGLDKKERARLRELVETATVPESFEAEAPAVESAEGDEPSAEVQLYDWYYEWSETARAVIKRRDHLIRLGLAKRKPAEKKGKGEKKAKESKPEGEKAKEPKPDGEKPA